MIVVILVFVGLACALAGLMTWAEMNLGCEECGKLPCECQTGREEMK